MKDANKPVKLFRVFYSCEAFSIDQAEHRTVEQGFFTKYNGYTESNKTEILNLNNGETWYSPEHGDLHTVKRIK